MIGQVINDFRAQNGRPPFYNWNSMENYHCFLHSQHMAGIRELCHAPECLRWGKGEAVGDFAGGSFYMESLHELIFGKMSSSEGHRAVLLCDNLAYDCCEKDGRIWLTVRGW